MDTVEWFFAAATVLGVSMVAAPGFYLWLWKRVVK
jgi:hypothetical protein